MYLDPGLDIESAEFSLINNGLDIRPGMMSNLIITEIRNVGYQKMLDYIPFK